MEERKSLGMRLERLMLDHDMDEVRATNVFYPSDTFARLADTAS